MTRIGFLRSLKNDCVSHKRPARLAITACHADGSLLNKSPVRWQVPVFVSHGKKCNKGIWWWRFCALYTKSYNSFIYTEVSFSAVFKRSSTYSSFIWSYLISLHFISDFIDSNVSQFITLFAKYGHGNNGLLKKKIKKAQYSQWINEWKKTSKDLTRVACAHSSEIGLRD